MVRPRKNRLVQVEPRAVYFKPRGVPLRELEQVILTVDELEALRLADLEGLSHEEAGGRMGVSRATFGRIVQNARKSVGDALVNGKAVLVEGGTYEKLKAMGPIRFACKKCGRRWEVPGRGKPPDCPTCKIPGRPEEDA
ncbi:MAG: DUF134 domain-containing protein [Deltaproteobacteria bacterium]|nr:DUF134 domain-containing protein [Deltaproteobacteria bacterium]